MGFKKLANISELHVTDRESFLLLSSKMKSQKIKESFDGSGSFIPVSSVQKAFNKLLFPTQIQI